METKREFGIDEAKKIGDQIGIDWNKIDSEEFRKGLEVEMEHGSRDPETNVTNDDPIMTGKIAWAHLKEMRNYYIELEKMEEQAKSAN